MTDKTVKAGLDAKALAVLTKLVSTATLLHQNSVGCAINHYGSDFELHGLPGWLADAENDIVAGKQAISALPHAEAEPIDAERIREVIKEGSANGSAAGWRSCTGCHETNEGAETGHYPYSKAFGCYVGAGCSECGGIGVIWEHWSKEALDDMARDLALPRAGVSEEMVDAAWNKGKHLRMTGRPSDFRQVLEAAFTSPVVAPAIPSAQFLPTEDGEFNGNELTPEDIAAALSSQHVEAVPVAWSLVWGERYGINAETTFKTEEQAQSYAAKCSAPRPRVVPLYASPVSADAGEPLAWAVERWRAEVANRPLVNVHRRGLDTAWRQVIRRFGGDDEALCGPRHDDLVAANPELFRAPTTSPAKGGSAADQIIGEIEERFPNWRSYRDLIDCIDCTLHDLRSALRTSAPVGKQAKEGEANG